MKDFPLKNIIEEWLDKNGNPEIARQVDLEAVELYLDIYKKSRLS